ncbi:bacteriohemerythrin [Xylophilus sp. ASV27]|uniref:bacteriohemerythrin n=1 Tax=Xylophilus sp. ASV27 TaxID=2795129 RepID=UPI0018EDB55B|nr:bacteriohemerythrin [Xylophilus sp. ASV27]
MAYFEWADDMVIDGGPIDQDHRHLVDLVNELHTATSHGTGRSVVASILSRTIESTREHLVREEELMARMAFPDLEAHKQVHAAFMEKLLQLQRRLDDGSITVASQLSEVLRDWLSLHIRRHDKEFQRLERRRQREQARKASAARRAR